MDFKDYYEILGVPPNAEKKVIQQTFRHLARKVHPDVNPGNKEAEEKFKTINEAYQVLSDAEKRKKYDELRAQYQRWQETGGRQQDFDWQNWSARPGQGVRVQYASPEDLDDLFGNESPYSDFFNSIFAQVRGRGRGSSHGGYARLRAHGLLQKSPGYRLRHGRAPVRSGLRISVHDLKLGSVLRRCRETGDEQDLESSADLLGLQENLIGISSFQSSVPKPIQQKVLAELKKMREGKGDSFLGPIKDQEGKVVIAAGQRATDKELLTMKWFVEAVVGKIPE